MLGQGKEGGHVLQPGVLSPCVLSVILLFLDWFLSGGLWVSAKIGSVPCCPTPELAGPVRSGLQSWVTRGSSRCGPGTEQPESCVQASDPWAKVWWRQEPRLPLCASRAACPVTWLFPA